MEDIMYIDARSSRQKLGDILFQNYKNGSRYEDLDYVELASNVDLTPSELEIEINTLKIAGYIDHASHSFSFDKKGKRIDGGPFPWEKYRRVFLTDNGILWAEAGFPRLSVPNVANVSVSVDIHIAINQTIQIISSVENVTQDQKDRLELLLKRLETELDKPRGTGRFAAVKDVLDVAVASKSLLAPVIEFMDNHWSEIERLL